MLTRYKRKLEEKFSGMVQENQPSIKKPRFNDTRKWWCWDYLNQSMTNDTSWYRFVHHSLFDANLLTLIEMFACVDKRSFPVNCPRLELFRMDYPCSLICNDAEIFIGGLKSIQVYDWFGRLQRTFSDICRGVPRGLWVDANSKTLVVACSNQGIVKILDAQTGVTLRCIEKLFQRYPYSVSVNESKRILYVCDDVDKKLDLYNFDTCKHLSSIDVGYHLAYCHFDNDLGFLYVCLWTNHIQVRLADGVLMKTIDVRGSELKGLCVIPGASIYVCDSSANEVIGVSCSSRDRKRFKLDGCLRVPRGIGFHSVTREFCILSSQDRCVWIVSPHLLKV